MPENIPNSDGIQHTEDMPVSHNIEAKKSISKKSLMVLVVVSLTILIMGVSAAAYNALVVNSPERIWDQAVQNTSDGFGELSQKLQENPINGGSIRGSFSSVAPIASTAVFNGKWHKNSAEFKGDIVVAGVKINGEMRVVGSDTTENSDIFMKLDGLDSAEPILRLVQPELADIMPIINSTWYRIDETILSGLATDKNDNKTSLSPEELSSAIEKLSTAVQERLFTTDESKAVFVVKNPVGREEFEGVDTYKYDVNVQKQQFIDFAGEVNTAAEGTKLQNSTEGLEELTKRLQEVDFSEIRAEAWVDMDMKYFRNVRFTLPDSYADSKGYVEFGLDYEGGDELPFRMRVVTESKTDTGDTLNLFLKSILNKETTDMKLSFTVSGSVDSQQIATSGELLIVPSDESLDVEAPNDVRDISELVSLLMSGDTYTFAEDEFEEIDINSYRLDDVEL